MSSAYQTGYAFGSILVVLLIFGVLAMGLVSIIMAFIRRTTGWIVTAVIFSLLGAGGVITGVVIAARGMGKVIAQQSNPKTVVSDDGWVRLEIPGNWTSLRELNAAPSLMVGNKRREEYAMLFSTPAAQGSITLDVFAGISVNSFKGQLGESAEIGPIEKATAGKYAARRCRIAGKAENVDIVYLNYLIETPEGVHQLIMWTLPRLESRARPVFERVAQSFEVANPPKSDVSVRKSKTQSDSPRKGTVEERLREIVVEQLGIPAEKVKPTARLKEDLGADELDIVELIMAVEEEFEIEIKDEDAEKITTVGQFAEYVSAHAKK